MKANKSEFYYFPHSKFVLTLKAINLLKHYLYKIIKNMRWYINIKAQTNHSRVTNESGAATENQLKTTNKRHP